MTAVSPLAPTSYPTLPPIAGVHFASTEAGIKHAGRTDVLLATFDKGTTAAGVFTRSKCPSAPVDWCRAALQSGKARALMVNAGNANAFTGKRGRETVKLSAAMVAEALGCRPKEVFLASTGVIGEPLDAAKFDRVVERLVAHQHDGPWIDAARAIMTTDTFPKVATRTAWIGDAAVAINGVAKGAGMIAPDMATMLSFIFTDAPIAAPVLQSLLSRGVTGSFNAITVDSDTSTSDTVLIFATGQVAGAKPITSTRDRRLAGFREALDDLLLDLAHQVVRDGEGARKFVEVRVERATSKRSAKRIALSIANSPLVKTALAGEDANWGRIVMAVGKAGEPADRDKLAIWFGDTRVAFHGERDPDYSEAVAAAYMKSQDIVITVDIGLGKGSDRVWTCDLTKEYVAINGDYRS
ncbi:bifunctional glutamate N-acetyltransferase/amino-acid acetyltransferase ArgJ [Bauldia litoralis]|uniref:bifunctional glutamate N-acetyltransferase/amino-acid acetyltransferase ArgJ n=1 Tax=Bauldia litoralis TaxID=665467 RepID=UPI0032653DD7